MILLVGLGNPGAKYARNRHNAGFLAVDAIADRWATGPERSKFKGLLREATVEGSGKILLLKPQTFYNESGNAVATAARFHKIPVENIVVFHDEIDLPPGKVRVKKGGGLAGNNGLRSTAAHLGPDFWRVRIGIGHPGQKDAVTHHVLGDFSKAESEGYLADILDGIARGLPDILQLSETGVGRFMSGIHQPGNKPASPATAAPKPSANPGVRAKGDGAAPSPFDALKALKDGD